MKVNFITFIILICSYESKDFGKCTDPTGNSVSWYIIYTMSNQYKEYSYIDNNKKTFANFNSTVEIFSPFNIVEGLNMKDNFSYIVWNDESIREDGDSSGFSKVAHSKGIILYDEVKKESTFLIHSLPKFPTLLANKTVSY